jgi:hypothetical protein
MEHLPQIARSLGWLLLAAVSFLAPAGCAGTPEPLPASLSETPPSKVVPENWPAPPQELERRLASEPVELRAAKPIGAGVTGALKITLFFPLHGESIAFKWKPVPAGDADGWNNAPRKEVAAYLLQSWFLDPPDYVVPTTAVRCLPVEELKAHGVQEGPSLPGTSCVIGVLSVWLDDVEVPDSIYDPERFKSDAKYASSLGRFNLFTYLIQHEDGRPGNFLVSEEGDDDEEQEEDEDPRVFAVDNGIAFNAPVKNVFVTNWNEIRIPALPHLEIERLRKIGRRQIDQLGVVTEMRADEKGVLTVVTPGPNRNPKIGARHARGWLQLGLTRSELDDLEERLQDLLARVDRGELPLF